MTNQELIDDLHQRTEWNLLTARKFLSLTDEQLNQREAADRWSVLECLEHLIRYSNFYLPEVGKTIATAPKSAATLAHRLKICFYEVQKLFTDHQPRLEARCVSYL